MCDHSEFIGFLDQQARRYRGLLENMFGQCDQRFVFGSIKKSIRKDDAPHTNFPNEFHLNGGCVVDIHISEWPWQHCYCDQGTWQHCYCDQGTWQLAYESVHLLDPVVNGKATFLEEGLATWFQDEPTFHIDVVQKYIERGITHPQDYTVAKELVCSCMPQITSVVKKIRSLGVRIQDITAYELAPCLPNVDREIIEHLCRRFPC